MIKVYSTIFSFSCATLLSTAISAAEPLEAEPANKIWISIGTDAAEIINQKYSDQIELSINSEYAINHQNEKNQPLTKVTIASLDEAKINRLSQLMHHHFNRCAGFIYHPSLAMAKKQLQYASHSHSAKMVDYTIDNALVVQELMTQLVTENLTSTVNNLSNYNNRYYTAPTGAEAAAWIKTEWEDIASTRSDISIEFFQHSEWQQPSIIATIEGVTTPNEIVVIGGHLDSINGSSPSTGRAPGADDNASGIAVITETLRAMVAGNYRPAKTIKLMGYAAEEVGLRGSSEIAQKYADDELNVIGVAQFDMTGAHGTASQDITFMADFTSATQNQFMSDLIDEYLPDLTYGYDLCGYACSDHASWNTRGFPASFPFESTFADHNNRIHTSNDNIFDPNHALKFAQLALTYAAEMAKGEIEGLTSATIQFATASTEVTEGASVVIEVQRSGNLGLLTTIDYSTIDGTAVSGTDYSATSGTLTWEAQESASKTFTISTLDVDALKSFSVALSNPGTGVEIGANNTMSINITPVEETPNAIIEFSTLSIDTTGTSNVSIEVQRSENLDSTITIDYSTIDGTAVSGTDYTATSGTLTWEPQESDSKTFTISTLGADSLKSFSVELSNPSTGGEIGSNSTVTININPSEEISTSQGGGSLGFSFLFGIMLFLRKKRRI